ncbi:hypothetical protein [Lentilactobacillus buchneri]|uniref:hypothetical protein n=1 Tax=Lentilactobacillus buchneri TaxID=1581 RepID=UPI00165D36F3|nr:hypothetical protein [Lentilactobacillus buchneri]
MQNAFKQMGKALTTLWFDKAKITGWQPAKHGSITSTEEVVIVEDEPCKISRKSLKPSDQKDFGTDEYDVVMYIRTGINIPAGSNVYITDANGKVNKYKQSGKAYTGYISHQEVALIRDEKAKEAVSNGVRNN